MRLGVFACFLLGAERRMDGGGLLVDDIHESAQGMACPTAGVVGSISLDALSNVNATKLHVYICEEHWGVVPHVSSHLRTKREATRTQGEESAARNRQHACSSEFTPYCTQKIFSLA